MTYTFELSPQVTLRCFPDSRFKQSALSIQFVRPMCREEAALNALLPAVLLPSAALLIWPDGLFGILQLLLPWRYLVSLICGLGLMICTRRRA